MGGENAQHRFSPGLETRLIPAHAGKTSSEPLSLASRPAHPHSRRENRPMTIVRPIHTDSSPLTRGKHAPESCARTTPGLIPAHAGKTCRTGRRERRASAHPRSRGENEIIEIHVSSFHGSSPLTRGKPVVCDADCKGRRLIPAHAGKTCRRASAACRRRAHPRSRGENRHSPFSTLQEWWLIPAHAGKTTPAPTCRLPPGAHPRSRGENQAGRRSGKLQLGSSPLTRGKQPSMTLTAAQPRLIPAHAGKTR